MAASRAERAAPSAAGDGFTIEDAFNQRLQQVLDQRGLSQDDLVTLLEDVGYTADVPATVLLNDALAIAAVLDVSPIALLLPDDDSQLSVTPQIQGSSSRLRQWFRGLRPLREERSEDFHRFVPLDDLRSEHVAENWIRAERVRVAGLALEIEAAVRNNDLERVRLLTDLAVSMVDRDALSLADENVEEIVTPRDLEDARVRGVRYRRQRQNLGRSG